MPYLAAKLTVPVSDTQKENLKAAFGEAISVIPGRNEGQLMVSIAGDQDLWLAGKKLVKGAYVGIIMFGEAPKEYCSAMTAKICDILAAQLDIPGSAVYVTYHPVNTWGYAGKNI